MEVVIQKLNTLEITVDYIQATIKKMIAEDKESRKINLSLDLTKPEFIMVGLSVVKSTLYITLHYYKKDRVIHSDKMSFNNVLDDAILKKNIRHFVQDANSIIGKEVVKCSA